MADNNLFLFTGLETYLLHAELKKRKQAFVEKYSEQGVFQFTADNLALEQIQNALMGGGMFSSKTLVIIYGIPKDTVKTNKAKAAEYKAAEEFLMNRLGSFPSESIVTLVSYKPDKRTKMYKTLAKEAKIKEFKPLSGTELIQFVRKQIGDLGDSKIAEQIIEKVGTDLYNIASECDKLLHYAHHNKIDSLTPDVVEQVVYKQSETDSFAILDNLFSNPKKTLDLVSSLQAEQPGEMFRFLGMMYRGLELVLKMADLHEQGITSSKALASKLKAHPFAVSKQLKRINYVKQHHPQIKQLYHRLLALDRNIKTGQAPTESFWLDIKSSLWTMSQSSKS